MPVSLGTFLHRPGCVRGRSAFVRAFQSRKEMPPYHGSAQELYIGPNACPSVPGTAAGLCFIARAARSGFFVWEPAPLTPEEEARIPKDLAAPYPGEVLVEAPAGSAIICNSSMWHAGTLKKTDRPRRMLHLTFTRRDLPQQLLQLDYLTPGLYNRTSP